MGTREINDKNIINDFEGLMGYIENTIKCDSDVYGVWDKKGYILENTYIGGEFKGLDCKGEDFDDYCEYIRNH